MIGRFILRNRGLAFARKLLHPCNPPSPWVPVAPLEHSRLGFSCHLSGQFVSTHFLSRFWFSSGALAENVEASGIVDVPLAQTGEGIAECELIKWFVKEGDQVDEFQPLCEVQSDKATIEITSRYKGRVSQLEYVPGDIVKVGALIMFLARGLCYRIDLEILSQAYEDWLLDSVSKRCFDGNLC